MRVDPDPPVLKRREEHDGDMAIAAPVWHELLHGARRLPRGRKRNAVEEFLEDAVAGALPILPYDQQAADVHASERARLTARGKSPPFVDGQVASIALVHGLTVATRNVSDFAQLKGLRVESWFQ